VDVFCSDFLIDINNDVCKVSSLFSNGICAIDTVWKLFLLLINVLRERPDTVSQFLFDCGSVEAVGRVGQDNQRIEVVREGGNIEFCNSSGTTEWQLFLRRTEDWTTWRVARPVGCSGWAWASWASNSAPWPALSGTTTAGTSSSPSPTSSPTPQSSPVTSTIWSPDRYTFAAYLLSFSPENRKNNRMYSWKFTGSGCIETFK